MNIDRTKLLKFAGYPAFFCFALVVFGYATFPFDRLAMNIINEVERTFGVTVELEGFEPSWGTGIEIERLAVTVPAARRNNPPARYEITELSARTSIFALLARRLAVDVEAVLAGGEIEATYSEDPEEAHLEIELSGVQLGDFPALQSLTGLPVSGGVVGTLDVTLPEKKLSKMNGHVELTIVDGLVGDKGAVIKAGLTGHLAYLAEDGITMEKGISLGRFRAVFDVKDGRATVEEFEAAGGDAEGTFSGSTSLRDRLAMSALGGYVQFKISEDYLRDSRKFTLLMGGRELKRAKRTDGYFGFKVTGTLGNPRFLAAKSDAKRPVTAARRGTAGRPLTPPGAARSPKGVPLREVDPEARGKYITGPAGARPAPGASDLTPRPPGVEGYPKGGIGATAPGVGAVPAPRPAATTDDYLYADDSDDSDEDEDGDGDGDGDEDEDGEEETDEDGEANDEDEH